jgi:adenylate cyclase class IV
MPRFLRRILFGVKSGGSSNFEVERKYSISDAERKTLPDKLLSMGYRYVGQAYMKDTFVPTLGEGDMCRVREETMNDRTKYLLTEKVWVQVGNERERKEDEEQITVRVAQLLLDLGKRLSGAELLSFSKDRDFYTRYDDEGRKITISIDLVEGLGEYDGHYMEIEILVAQKCHVAAARKSIEQLVQDVLGETRPVADSYMEMLKRSRSR